MSGGQVPAGWFPDPYDPSRLRYWDGTAWTEHRSPATPAPPVHPAQIPPNQQAGQQPPTHTAASASSPRQPGSKRSGMWWKVSLAVLAGLVVIGMITDSSDSETPKATAADAGNASAASGPVSPEPSGSKPAPTKKARAAKKVEPVEKAKPAYPYGHQAGQQAEFVRAVVTAQREANRAADDLHEGAALSRRNAAICRIVGAGSVSNWVGRVSNLDANGSGKGILGIDLAPDVNVTTWNNELSDIGDNTLIGPGPLFNRVLKLHEGQLVRFSGQFRPDLGGPCVNDSRLTLDGKVTTPEFIFRFSDVNPVS